MIRSKASEPADCERMLLSRTRLKTLRIQLLLLRILLDALLLHRPFWMCCDVVTLETQDVASAPHLKRQHLICCNAVFVCSLKAALERDAGKVSQSRDAVEPARSFSLPDVELLFLTQP